LVDSNTKFGDIPFDLRGASTHQGLENPGKSALQMPARKT